MFNNLKVDISRRLRSWGKKPSFLEIMRLFFRHPCTWAVLNHRIKYWSNKHLFPIPVIGIIFYIPYRYIFDNFVTIISGTDIGSAKIGKGFVITHGHGLVINGDAELGENCTVHHQVTIGSGKNGVPKIGKNVVLCTGSKIIGGVKIGDNSIVGANAVVVKDVPKNCVVGGVPAKILHKR